MLHIYGLAQCDSCRQAVKWLKAQKIAYRFIDLRQDGFAEKDLQRWLAACGHEKLINRRSTSWRQLTTAQQNIADDKAAQKLALAMPTLIKRPVFDNGKNFIHVGFTPAIQAELKKL